MPSTTTGHLLPHSSQCITQQMTILSLSCLSETSALSSSHCKCVSKFRKLIPIRPLGCCSGCFSPPLTAGVYISLHCSSLPIHLNSCGRDGVAMVTRSPYLPLCRIYLEWCANSKRDQIWNTEAACLCGYRQLRRGRGRRSLSWRDGAQREGGEAQFKCEISQGRTHRERHARINNLDKASHL